MTERRNLTDEERYLISELRERNNIANTVPDEEVLPPLDEHVEYRMEEFRFGFSFPWRMVNHSLQERIINYERLLAGDPIFNENPEMYWTELFDDFKTTLDGMDWRIAREIAERYGLWSAYPLEERP